MPDASLLTRSLEVIFWMGAPVLTGWLLWRRCLRHLANGERRAATLARNLGRLAILGFAAPLMLLVVWVAPLPAGETAFLPLVGLAVHVSGTLAGWGWARARGESRRRQGAFLLGGGLSNIFTFGSITIVLLLSSADDPGAEGPLATMAIYRLAEAPYYFLVAWPLAAAIATVPDEKSGPYRSLWRGAVRSLRGPTTAPLVGILLGLILNVAGFARPRAFDGLAPVIVHINVTLLGISVGLGFRRVSPAKYLGPCLAVSAIKFVLMPSMGLGLAIALGFHGGALQVIAVCATMPVAFMAVVGAVLYELDEELVRSFWLFTTLAMFIVVPILAVVVPLLGGR